MTFLFKTGRNEIINENGNLTPKSYIPLVNPEIDGGLYRIHSFKEINSLFISFFNLQEETLALPTPSFFFSNFTTQIISFFNKGQQSSSKLTTIIKAIGTNTKLHSDLIVMRYSFLKTC